MNVCAFTLQAAHIGVGISGREGLQATLASDYAISQVGTYRISSNSSHPPNRPRPRIDRVRRLEASEMQRALELSTRYNYYN